MSVTKLKTHQKGIHLHCAFKLYMDLTLRGGKGELYHSAVEETT